MSTHDLNVLILAAGKGTRMRSQLAKVLHPLGGIPLAAHPIHLSQSLSPKRIVLIIGHQAEAVQEQLDARFGQGTLRYALQAEQRGTAHAVQCAQEHLIDGPSEVLLLCGDVPLLSEETLREMIQRKEQTQAAIGMITFEVEDPTGYGRIVRDEHGKVQKIQEHKDCNTTERKIKECNAAIYLVERDFLLGALDKIDDQNAQGEFYLTDIVSLAVQQGRHVEALIVKDAIEVMGVNDRAQLSFLEQEWLHRRQQHLMKQGVTMHLPDTIWMDYDVSVESDVEIGPHCAFYGKTSLGEGAHVGAGSYLKDTTIPANTTVPARTTRGFE
ncbi:MAG: bifunctional N-acetylglucosamine-1-phosphate uridyltransferase/glucosamine-1-phosphate acetyltransferase [Myxococcales bacterium]|nr:bifunctional N-acetylglucosamine-1-phosphate uridyltransferase/glucosamine-1-phosphate acetyltransferase [Myxococcales bacterium]MCB9644239.1 bifunctional N-acetylglucosamine-1-phosphate uridyltransferase/glucosamine-1-phosphate acetyltransferase [Myxococcales bacterium]